MSHYALKDIRAGYGGDFVLKLPELTTRARRLTMLTGPNGCGKTTLLTVLAFLKRPEHGQVSFNDTPVRWRRSELAQLRKRVTLLHQNPFLFTASVEQNVAYGLKLRGQSRDAIRCQVAEALALVALDGFEQRSVRELSGGESRRVALARALALKPEVLLLDEPLANLDLASARVIERVVAGLPEVGTTVIISTHDLAITERLDCDVIRLVDGRIKAVNEINVCRPLMMPGL